MERTITICFLSDWLLSSGLGDGSLADSVLIRDSHGIPYIPGRTLKGLLREGARELALTQPELSGLHKKIFGTPSEGNDAAPSWRQGGIRVGRGDLNKEIRDLLLSYKSAQRARFVSDLTNVHSQTAIDMLTNSTVKHSLRSIECGVAGLSFNAEISIDVQEDPDWAENWFQAVCSLVRTMGSGRNRGLGRCRIDCPQWKDRITSIPAIPSGGAAQ